ncbi:MAG: hypothetical protein QW116_04960 [Zestosphaera sp.]
MNSKTATAKALSNFRTLALTTVVTKLATLLDPALHARTVATAGDALSKYLSHALLSFRPLTPSGSSPTTVLHTEILLALNLLV